MAELCDCVFGGRAPLQAVDKLVSRKSQSTERQASSASRKSVTLLSVYSNEEVFSRLSRSAIKSGARNSASTPVGSKSHLRDWSQRRARRHHQLAPVEMRAKRFTILFRCGFRWLARGAATLRIDYALSFFPRTRSVGLVFLFGLPQRRRAICHS